MPQQQESAPQQQANFYGNDVAELRREFSASVDEYLASCEEDGVEFARPFPGNRRPASRQS